MTPAEELKRLILNINDTGRVLIGDLERMIILADQLEFEEKRWLSHRCDRDLLDGF